MRMTKTETESVRDRSGVATREMVARPRPQTRCGDLGAHDCEPTFGAPWGRDRICPRGHSEVMVSGVRDPLHPGGHSGTWGASAELGHGPPESTLLVAGLCVLFSCFGVLFLHTPYRCLQAEADAAPPSRKRCAGQARRPPPRPRHGPPTPTGPSSPSWSR